MVIKNSVVFEIVATPSGIVDLVGGGVQFTNSNVGYSGTGVYGGNNRCLTFDPNTYGHLDLTNIITLTGDFTISAWVYPKANKACSFINIETNSNIYTNENDTSLLANYSYINDGHSLIVLLNQFNKSGMTKMVEVEVPAIINWIHFAITRYNGEFHFFINGIEWTTDIYGAITTETLRFNNLRIGSVIGGVENPDFNPVYMDDICILNEALWTSDFDVPTDYVGLAPRSNTNKLMNNFRIGSI